MSINQVERIDDKVKIQNVLISVSDKTGLSELVSGLLKVNPQVRIFSTGGTFQRLKEILGSAADTHLTPVSSYTGQPETQGGLVKTLDFKIYLGLLTETYNSAHQSDLERTSAVPIDLVVVNLYPFESTIAAEGATSENARGNIDIGGPCMVRASAKNFIRVASMVDPKDYPQFISQVFAEKGATTLEQRFQLAQKAFSHTADYDTAISKYLGDLSFDAVKSCYTTSD